MDEAEPSRDDETILAAETPQATAPECIPVSLKGFDTEEHARAFGNLVADYTRALSRYIDLAALDGITIAFDYNQALLDIDHGYETSRKLTPSEGIALGVAMTPAVMRAGVVKSHMLFHAGVLLPLEDENSEDYQQAIHTLAHECAHVEVTERIDRAFPGTILQKKYSDHRTALRWDVIRACWDEYAVTRICAQFGKQATEGYEETFIASLQQTRDRANELIKAFRLHGNVGQIAAEVYGTYGELMKFASCHLGNMAGLGLTLDDLPRTKEAIAGHWFEPHFERLNEACQALFEKYGKWNDATLFEAIGDLVEDVLADGGVFVSPMEDGQFYMNIPYRPETMP
ncbi:hypothetical protein P0R31_33690 [Bradyrhizobium yuanmingense]|uniref:hypothetical protein n=1 Tax=Bradyrhizobium yuanmingense TaxID=108015 RepID=UPI0023B99A0D|nr:hypothetical protein [Bradyrhizobium yuanmingense]MDF0522197.1 hypothetical protein [Bradyrhizobium yuanmingense]